MFFLPKFPSGVVKAPLHQGEVGLHTSPDSLDHPLDSLDHTMTQSQDLPPRHGTANRVTSDHECSRKRQRTLKADENVKSLATNTQTENVTAQSRDQEEGSRQPQEGRTLQGLWEGRAEP